MADPWDQEFKCAASLTLANQYVASCYAAENKPITIICANDQAPTDYFSVELNGEVMEAVPFGKDINSLTCNGAEVVWSNPGSVTMIVPDGRVSSCSMPADKKVIDSTIDGNGLVWLLMDDGLTAGVWDTEHLATFLLPGERYRCIAVGDFDNGICAFKENQDGSLSPVKIMNQADGKAEPVNCYLKAGRKKIRRFETVSVMGPIIAAVKDGLLYFITLSEI